MRAPQSPQAQEPMGMEENIDGDVEGPGFDDSGPSTSKGMSWSYEASCKLISSMGNHYADFNNPKKRKYIFEMACNDLISEGFTVSAAAVQNKWKGLVRSYNKAKDIKMRTGMGPSRFNFFDQLDEILGNKPKNHCSHSINSMVETPASEPENMNPEPQTKCTEKNERTEEVPEGSKKRKKLSELHLKQNYMDMKKKEYERRQKRHDENVAIEKEKLNLFRELINLKKKKEK